MNETGLKVWRKANKIKIQDIKLDRRTIEKIENGENTVTVQSLRIYLAAIGLELVYATK